MGDHVGGFMDTVGSIFRGSDTLPWCDRDIIAVRPLPQTSGSSFPPSQEPLLVWLIEGEAANFSPLRFSSRVVGRSSGDHGGKSCAVLGRLLNSLFLPRASVPSELASVGAANQALWSLIFI
jgi:hypothetical protein